MGIRNCLLAVICVVFSVKLRAQIYVADDIKFNRTDSNLIINDSSLNFIVIGDWGRNGADHQKEVAAQMGKAAAKVKSEFVIAAGDNFYPAGVISDRDPLFYYSFENIYTDFSLQWDWYPVLGNHDYKSNPGAEVAYSKISRRWKMPARYYEKKFLIKGDSTKQVLIIFLDTNPLIPEYYSKPEYSSNVKTQDSTAQKKWLIKMLSDPSPNIKWKIVVGHHPMYSAGGRTEEYDTKAIRNSLKPVFDKYKVDVYLAGHEHSLQHLVVPGTYTQQFISGAASERTPVHLIPEARMAASEYGFMVFSVTADNLLVQTVDDKGNVFYRAQIKK
jgi:tartrate-resistant acid phosphatase type 5